MVTKNADRAITRYLAGLRRVRAGLEGQRQRVIDGADAAPRLAGIDREVVDFTGDVGLDLDYYIFELVRLRDVAGAVIRSLDPHSLELKAARERFIEAIPHLADLRSRLTHLVDLPDLDDVSWFNSVVRLLPGGKVEYLVDPRYQHHDAAMALVETLETYLRGRLRVSIALDPPAPLKEQIARRNGDEVAEVHE